MTRSQWLIKGTDANGKPTEVHHHGMEVHRRLPDGTWVYFIDHPFGADPDWAVEAPRLPDNRWLFHRTSTALWMRPPARCSSIHSGYPPAEGASR